MSKHHLPVDYWVCESCGTQFGPDQSECPDPECQQIHLDRLRDQDLEDYARQEQRLIIEEELIEDAGKAYIQP